MDTLKDLVSRFYAELDGVFTDKEAWFLFRASAFLETIGWTLLIIGIVFSRLEWPGYEYILPIAGTIHGVFFLVYVLIVFFAHRSMKWSFRRLIVAELVGNIPYGALVMELWVRKRRRAGKF